MRENVFFSLLRVLSAELYDQILELCLYLHTAFPAFFPFILCTTKMTDFFDTFGFPPEQYNNNCKAHIRYKCCTSLVGTMNHSDPVGQTDNKSCF